MEPEYATGYVAQAVVKEELKISRMALSQTGKHRASGLRALAISLFSMFF